MHATRPLFEDAIVRYAIDARASTFFAQAFSTGLLSAFGHNPKIAVRDFEGEAHFTLTGSALESAGLRIKIRPDSMEVVDDISEKDRQEIHRKIREEVLETGSFPEITYDCARVTASGTGDRFWVGLNGELTLRGVTQTLPVSVRVVINGKTMRASGDFSVRQSDFGIAPVTAAAGAIRVKDEVRCTFDIVARQQE